VHFSTLLKSGGQLVLSGILHKQVEMILAAYGDYFSALKVTKKDDWCSIAFWFVFFLLANSVCMPFHTKTSKKINPLYMNTLIQH
jgi:hypothetical protein